MGRERGRAKINIVSRSRTRSRNTESAHDTHSASSLLHDKTGIGTGPGLMEFQRRIMHGLEIGTWRTWGIRGTGGISLGLLEKRKTQQRYVLNARKQKVSDVQRCSMACFLQHAQRSRPTAACSSNDFQQLDPRHATTSATFAAGGGRRPW